MFVKSREYLCIVKNQEMQTFILPWEPDDTGYSVEQLQKDLRDPDFGTFYWKAYGLDKARSGDNFVLVWMSESPFVVMKGFFLTDPDMEKDQIDLRPSFIAISAAELPHFSMDALDRSSPGFSWRIYCDGEPLPEWAGKKLAGLWEVFLQEEFYDGYFDGVQAERSRKPAANVDDAIQIASEVFCDEADPLDGKPAILSCLRLAMRYKKEESVICAAMRDVIGRCGWTPGRLRDWGFSESMVDRLVLLKSEKGMNSIDRLLEIGHSGDRLAFHIAADDLEERMARDTEDARRDYARMLGVLYEAAGRDYEL